MGPGDPIQFPEGGYTDFEWSLLVCPVAGVSREGEPAGSPWECVSGGEEPWGGGGGRLQAQAPGPDTDSPLPGCGSAPRLPGASVSAAV